LKKGDLGGFENLQGEGIYGKRYSFAAKKPGRGGKGLFVSALSLTKNFPRTPHPQSRKLKIGGTGVSPVLGLFVVGLHP
jgi:hypothetical protein